MKKIFLLLLSIFFFYSCEQKKIDDDWMSGGTLHKVTVKEWENAGEKNKLATCADFVATLKTNKGEKYNTIGEMKVDATDMKKCIDEAIKGDIVDDIQVAEIAIGCDVIMNN